MKHTEFYSLPPKASTTSADLLSRSQLIRENGGRITGDVWVPNWGTCVVWSFTRSIEDADAVILDLYPVSSREAAGTMKINT